MTKSDHLLKLFRKACSIEREALIIISGTAKIITVAVAVVKESFACFRVAMQVTRYGLSVIHKAKIRAVGG